MIRKMRQIQNNVYWCKGVPLKEEIQYTISKVKKAENFCKGSHSNILNGVRVQRKLIMKENPNMQYWFKRCQLERVDEVEAGATRG